MKHVRPMTRAGLLLAAGLVLTTTPAWAVNPDMAGTWVLDLDASDSNQPLLKAQGVNLVVRTAARGMAVTQRITVTPDVVTIAVESALRNQTKRLITDNTVRRAAGESGTASVRHYWSEQDTLISVAETATDGVPGALTVRRSLSADGKTLNQQITLQQPNGTIVTTRVFRRE
ncbi:MAG: hypothetical protein VX000_01205 [Myxococcota bacterium]|nr:hypothetical protein [Myxococcota bacterium]